MFANNRTCLMGLGKRSTVYWDFEMNGGRARIGGRFEVIYFAPVNEIDCVK